MMSVLNITHYKLHWRSNCKNVDVDLLRGPSRSLKDRQGQRLLSLYPEASSEDATEERHSQCSTLRIRVQ